MMMVHIVDLLTFPNGSSLVRTRYDGNLDYERTLQDLMNLDAKHGFVPSEVYINEKIVGGDTVIRAGDTLTFICNDKDDPDDPDNSPDDESEEDTDDSDDET